MTPEGIQIVPIDLEIGLLVGVDQVPFMRWLCRGTRYPARIATLKPKGIQDRVETRSSILRVQSVRQKDSLRLCGAALTSVSSPLGNR